MWRKWIPLVLLVPALLVAALLWREWQLVTTEPLALTEARTMEVERGDSLHRVARRLENEGILANADRVRYWARLSGRGDEIRRGEYRLEPGMTLPELVDKLERGEVVQYRFTMVEGWTVRRLLEALGEHEAVKTTLGDVDETELMPLLGYPEWHAEGWFLPDTYSFPRGTTDRELLSKAHRAMRDTLEETWEARQMGLPLEEPYEALILASIIERETGAPHERERVAGVFIRRLQQNMRLQTDPTVIYGLDPDDFDGRLRYRHLRTDTPYNTYTRHGLPPTPIALPGRESIRAAVNPDDSEYLYFVSRGDGTHHFSRTLEEHNRAVQKYQLGQEIELEAPREESNGD